MPKQKASGYWLSKVEELRSLGEAGTQSRYDEALGKWEKQTMRPWLEDAPERRKSFSTTSGFKLKALYGPSDTEGIDATRDLGFPGAYPFTRGIYPTMYRGRQWTMRMFSGFGTPKDTNRRLKYLLSKGETGLSIAFDMPTLYGYDADDERASGEVGKCGVNVGSVGDMERLFSGIPLGEVSTSMTINAPAAVLMAMYLATAKVQRVPFKKLRGTTQTDILKEYIAQKEWAFPPEAHMRLIRDMMVYCTRNVPQWNYISISGYHIREAGASALQELAFTLADGFSYLDLGISAGLPVDSFAPRLSFFFNSTMNFFEEVAKFRAARRIWATVLKEKYGAKDPRSLLLRFHTQTSGASLTWQQPLNNIVRTAIEALAATLGGTQSLHTNAFDEAWALPTEESAEVALRTQQVIAEETGIADVVDPMGGSYYLEWLTRELEQGAYAYFDKIERLGGVIGAIKTGYLQREIADTSYESQKMIEEKRSIVVGVNDFKVVEKRPIKTLKIDEKAQRAQREALANLRKTRDAASVKSALSELRRKLRNEKANSMPTLIKAVSAGSTLGEIMQVGREIYGPWQEPMVI